MIKTISILQAKACADSEDKIVGNAVKGTSKRRENRIRRQNEERKEDLNHFNVNNRKTHVREERIKRKHVDNEESDGYRSAWGSKFLARISKMLRKRVEQAGNSPKFQRSIRIDLSKEQGRSEQDSDDRSEEGTVDDKPENIRNTTARRHNNREAESFGKGGRRRRDLGKKLMEISARRDNRKNSRAVDARDYLNERRARRRDDSRKEGLVTPFNPRIVMSKTDSGENNFYGFFRQAPVKGFPESDVYGTVGNSSEQTGADYDYVQDDENNDDDDDDARSKNTRRFGGETSTENIWIEDEHSDYVPNEFFENVKLSSTGVGRGNSMDYGDLWEAESFSATEFADSRAQKSEPRSPVYSLDSASHAQNRPVQDDQVRDARTKRNSEQLLREILAEEMFKQQDEGNAKDCQCRIIRNFDSPENSGNEVAKRTTDVMRSRRNVVGDLETREEEERGEDTSGEATANESEKIDTTTEIPIEDATRTIETTGVTSAVEESDARAPVATPVSSTPSEFSATSDDIVTKQTFFPTHRSTEIRSSGEETTALDNAQTVSTISADSAENWGRYSSTVSIGAGIANHEKTENVIVEKKKTTENVTFSAFAVEQRRNESRYDENSEVIEYLGESMKTIDAKQIAAEMNMSKENDEKVAITRSSEMQSDGTGTQSVSETIDARQITTEINMLKEDDEKLAITRSKPEIQSDYETTTAYDISRVTTEKTSVLKKEEVADESIDNVKLGECAMKNMLRQKATDRNGEFEVVARKKDADTSKSKTTSPTVHKVPLRKLTRYDEYLIRRAEQFDKKLRERFAKLGRYAN